MKKLSKEEVLHVATLARLELNEDEIEKYAYQLKEILNEKKNEFADLMYVLTEEHSEVKDSSKKVTFLTSEITL